MRRWRSARVLFFSEWDWDGAERSLTRALALNPQHTEAMLIYGRLLDTRGRLEGGLAMKLKALERDPVSPLVHVEIARSYWNQRRYDESIDWANKALDSRSPSSTGARVSLCSLLSQGRLRSHVRRGHHQR